MRVKAYRQTITTFKWIIPLFLLIIVIIYLQDEGLQNEVKPQVSESLQQWMAKFRINKTASPRRIQNVHFYNHNREPVFLRDFEGKEIIIMVWATWCGPCREEMPYFNSIMPELALQGIQLLPVSVDTGGVSDVKQFYDSLGVDLLPIFNAPGINLLEALEVGPIPTFIIVNADGYEVGRRTGSVPVSELRK